MFFRLKIVDGDNETITEWFPEAVRFGQGATAGQRLNEIRAQYPQAKIAIERREVKPETAGENETTTTQV